MFVDKAEVIVQAGNGGKGAVSFRHEKYVDRGGPDGGNGGKGGDVVLEADGGINTLVRFRHSKRLIATNGQDGGKRKRNGKVGNSSTVKVPIGTVVTRDNKIIADLTSSGQQQVIAYGGDGGFGNAHFVSSTRQAPRIAELGEKGESFVAQLELKLLADVGLVGLPNAGKSTFLSVVTNATPEIADYPFTTLTPHLGVAEIDDSSLLIADIPGLIDGASRGKGLGDEFLRHVERTSVLLHLVDAWSDDVVRDYQTIRKELSDYSSKLARRRTVVALSKTDGINEQELSEKLKSLKRASRKDVFILSSSAHTGLNETLRTLLKFVSQSKARKASRVKVEVNNKNTITLDGSRQSEAWSVVKDGEKRFIVSGEKIEKFARRTDLDSRDGVDRLRNIMMRLGIMHELERSGIESGDKIIFGEDATRNLTY